MKYLSRNKIYEKVDSFKNAKKVYLFCEGDKINALKKFIEEKNKDYKVWFVVQSNPSFELWLYYHFYSEKPQLTETSKFASFKEYVDSKIKGGFDNRGMPLEVQKATFIAEQNFEILNGQPELYSTEVFNLAKQIIRFTKPQLDQCLEDRKNSPAGKS
jgi:hypothetical protein